MLSQMTRFHFFNVGYVYVCIYIYTTVHISFIYLSIDGCLGYFLILAIINNAVMYIGVHISFQISVFLFLRKIARSGIAGSYGSSYFVKESPFKFFKKFYWLIVDLQCCISFRSTAKCISYTYTYSHSVLYSSPI